MKKDNTKFLAVFLVLLTIIVLAVSFFSKEKKEEKGELYIVTSPSQFFTVNSCIYRTITYVSKKNTDSLMNVLDKNYLKKNSIKKENVLTVFPKIEENSTFVSKKMYYKKLSKYITKYYVYGMIKKEILHDYSNIENEDSIEKYFIVTLDSKNQTFSIEPCDKKTFLEGEKNE